MAEEKELRVRITAKDEASATVGKVSKEFQKTSESIKKVALAAGAAAIGFAGLGVKAVQDVANLAEELTNLSAKTSFSVESLSALKVQAEQSGIGLGTFEGAIKKMNLNLADISENSEKWNDDVKALGLTIGQLNAQTPEESFLSIGNAIAKLEDPTKRAEEAMKFFGKAGMDLLPFFMQGNLDMEEMKKKAEELGVSLDEGAAQKALAADEAFDKLDQQMKGVWQTIGIELAPVVTKLVELISTNVIPTVIEWVKKISEIAEKIVDFWNKHESLRRAVEIAWAAIKVVWEVGTKAIATGLESVFSLLDRWVSFFDDLISAPQKALEKISGIAADIGRALANIVPGGNMVVSSVNQVLNQSRSLNAIGGASALAGAPRRAGAISGTRAHGGPVSGGSTYLVGEQGPELFVPNSSGNIVPGGGVTINVTGNYLLDRQAGTKIGDLIFNQLRLNQKV